LLLGAEAVLVVIPEVVVVVQVVCVLAFLV